MSLRHPKDEGERWVQLTLAMMAIWLGLFVFMAVIPSWWLYFWDSTLKLTATWTFDLGVRKLVLNQQAFRDLIVVGWYGVVLVAAGVAVGVYNRRRPKVLPRGEEKREATGGYK